MTPTTNTAKTRTAALPNINKGHPTAQGFAKTNGAVLSLDGAWNGIIFGPYLVPLTRRVE